MHSSEKHTRSIVKALSYRFVSIIVDSFIFFIITKRYDFTIAAVLTSNFVSVFLYFFHERAWNSIGWGKFHKNKNIKIEEAIEGVPVP